MTGCISRSSAPRPSIKSVRVLAVMPTAAATQPGEGASFPLSTAVGVALACPENSALIHASLLDDCPC